MDGSGFDREQQQRDYLTIAFPEGQPSDDTALAKAKRALLLLQVEIRLHKAGARLLRGSLLHTSQSAFRPM